MTSYTIDMSGEQVTAHLAGIMTFKDYAASDEIIDAVFGKVDGRPAGSIGKIVFDLAEVSMVDSHWLGMFVRALRRAEASGVAIVLRNAQPPVRRLFDLVQFNRVFSIEP